MSYGKKHEDKVTRKGTALPLIDLKGKPYLQVAHRIVWFREEHPNGDIQTELVKLGDDHAVAKAVVYDGSGKRLSTGHKKETEDNFGDFIEKAETGAIGRALALAGYGTQFEPELDEGDRLADSPIPVAKKQSQETPKHETEDSKPENAKVNKAVVQARQETLKAIESIQSETKAVSKPTDAKVYRDQIKSAAAFLKVKGTLTPEAFKAKYGITIKLDEMPDAQVMALFNNVKQDFPELKLQ